MNRPCPPYTSDNGSVRLQVIGVDIMPASPLIGTGSQPGPALQRLDNKQGNLSMAASPLFWGGSPALPGPGDLCVPRSLGCARVIQRASAQQPGRGPSPPPPGSRVRSS